MREEFEVAREAKKKIEREGNSEKLKEAVSLLFDLVEACSEDLDVALVLLPQLDAEVKKLKNNVTNELIQRNFDTMMNEVIEELEQEGWE